MLAVLNDHRVGAVTHRCRFPDTARLHGLSADRTRRQQATEEHPLITESDANRLISVPRLRRLTPVESDVVREHDLAIIPPDDPLTTGQLDQDGSHDSIVTSRRTQSHSTTANRALSTAAGPHPEHFGREFRA